MWWAVGVSWVHELLVYTGKLSGTDYGVVRLVGQPNVLSTRERESASFTIT